LSFLANLSDKAVLPDAVGPTKKYTVIN